MYLQYYALAFFVFALVDSNNWRTWALLVCCCLLLKLNVAVFDTNTDTRYILRTLLIFIFAGLLLREKKIFAVYHSVILLLFLVANFLMLSQVDNSNFFYANYEAIIYALVCAQFVGIIPRIRCYTDNSDTDYISSGKNPQLVDRV